MSALHTLASTMTDVVAAIPVNVPNPPAQQPPNTGGITTLLGWIKWVGYAVVGGAIVIGGTLIAVSFKRGDGHDALPKVLFPMLGAIIIGAGASWVSTIASS